MKLSNFRFQHADVHNTAYNPAGSTSSATYRCPYADSSFDVVSAASVFIAPSPMHEGSIT